MAPAGGADEALVDPTRPAGWSSSAAVASDTPAPMFRVTLVKVSSTLRMAVVNGRSVRAGDEVDGARVVSIARSGVELEYGGGRLQAALAGPGGTMTATPAR